jgi:glutamate-1-semialdehyde 2,1-aminomutase
VIKLANLDQSKEFSLEQSHQLFERAKAVIPSGVYGHQNPAFFVEGKFPIFLSEADGCRVVDPDGNSYIDFLCAFGPMVVGYRNQRVEEAARRQALATDVGNLPAPVMVELAEKLVSMTPGADWAVFAKTGSDVTSWSLAVARAATKRDLIVMVDGAYHGVHGWCNLRRDGFPEAERALVRTVPWNDLDAARALFAAEGDRIAGLITTPFRHEAGADSVMPIPGYLEGLRAVCTEHESLLIVDDVRAGFRINIGGSTQAQGVTPDLLLYAKALSNGRALSAMLGSDAFKEAAASVFVTGTAFTQAEPMAAALATLNELERIDAIPTMDRLGRRLWQGLETLSATAGLGITMSGPPSIPFMTFRADEGNFERSLTFAAAWARAGVFVHPFHNWFLSAAHSDADIDEALKAAELAFAATAEVHGRDI